MARTDPSATDLLARLVAFDTTSANSNLPLIEYVADYLDGNDVAVRLIHDEHGQKANLFATLGPHEAGGVVLSGHTDVVPTTGQPWHSDPFTLIERDDRLYGRGTADMKGFIAAALALIPEFAGRPFATPLHLALSYDEEVGCIGVRRMIDVIREELPRPGLVVVGEPTEMRVVNAHKGISQQTTTVIGRDAHSSRPADGLNAVAYAAEIIGFLNLMASEMSRRPGPDARFDPPGTTFNIGVISGGTAVNIIARECRFRWEFRPVPGVDPRSVLDRLEAFVDMNILPPMRAVDPDASVVTTCEVTAPTLEPVDNSPAERLAMQLTGDNSAGAVSFVCEAGLFAQAGIPAIVCGPGSIAQAHQPNEYLEPAQLAACSDFLRRLMERTAAGL